MASECTLRFSQQPSLVPIYVRAIFSRRGGLRRGSQLPAISAIWDGVSAEPGQLQGYREICGFADDGTLPILFPYVMTMGVQMAMMSDARFPLKLMGTVHHRNFVLQHRAISAGESLNVVCRLQPGYVVKQGLEFAISTLVSVGDERVWECISTYLSRGRCGEPDPTYQPPRPVDLENPEKTVEWRVAGDTAKRYAKVSGDYNPIHVSYLLARLFGFPRTIVHGMWSAASCVSHLPQPPKSFPQLYEVFFKGPVFPGSNVAMKSCGVDGGTRFDLFCGDNPRPVIMAQLRNTGLQTKLIDEA